MRKKIEKKFWDMEIIGNRRKMAFQHKKLLINLKWLFGLFAPAPTKSLIDKFLIEMHNFDGYWMHLVKNLLKF